MKKKLAIFDFDGVFWNSEFIWIGALFYVLQSLGKKLFYDDLFALLAGTSHLTKKDFILKNFDVDIDDPKNKEKKKNREVELQSEAKLTDNMEKVFKYLKQNDIQMCIATGAPAWAVLEKVDKWGLEKYFSNSNIITAKEVEKLGGKGKPEPDIFLYAARKMGYTPE